MSEDRTRPDPSSVPPIRVEAGEPASTRPDARVPSVEAWQRAADAGAQRRQEAATRALPGWVPASASIPRALLREIVDWCLAGRPDEACGLLAAPATAEDGGVPTRFLGLTNAAASPYRYLIDPDEQLRAMLDIDDADEVVWGIVHSHVTSLPQPSATDVGLAAYPDALYLICSLAGEPPVVRAWTIRDGSPAEVVLEIV